MSVDQLTALPPGPALHAGPPIDASTCEASSQEPDEGLPRVLILASVATDTVDTLLLSVAHGDEAAFVALRDRLTGLVLVNVRRVLRDAARSQAVTEETFAELLRDAVEFDPQRDNAQTWLLTRAHQHAMERLLAVDAVNEPQEPRCDPAALVSLP